MQKQGGCVTGQVFISSTPKSYFLPSWIPAGEFYYRTLHTGLERVASSKSILFEGVCDAWRGGWVGLVQYIELIQN